MARLPVRAAALFVIAASLTCKDDSVAPTGTPATVLVRAYVDADGSASFTAGDDPIANQPVALVAGSGATVQATTDAAGLATFSNVATGVYVARFDGTAPTGALLATATEAAVAVLFQGGEVSVEFRFVFLPGSLLGTVFRDENGNGTYDAGTDTPGSGITVSLFAGAAVSPDTLDAAVTGSGGEFAFTDLRPGPYTVAFEPPVPTIQIVGGATRTVDVPPAAPASMSVQFTGSLLVSIAEAKADSGSIVTVEGVVTAAQGTFRAASDNAYIQDNTAGVQIFDLDPALALVVGDSIRITGRMGAFSGEREILEIDVSTPPTVTKVGTGTVPTPRIVDGAEIIARTFEGELVRAVNVKLTAAPTAGTTAYNLRFVDAADDTFTVRIETPVVSSVPRTGFWTSGAGYNIVGLLGSFSGTAQLKPRGAGDIQSVAPITLAKLDIGNIVLIEGVVTVAQGTFRSDNGYLQDTSSGIQLFNLPAGLNLAVGDSVRVAGIMGAFAGEQEIVRFSFTEPPVVFSLGAGTPIVPRSVTGAEIKARTFEGDLVTAANVQLTAAPTGTSGAYNINFVDAAADTFQVRIESPVATAVPRSFWTAGKFYDLTGALGSFNGVAQLKPRGPSDIVDLGP